MVNAHAQPNKNETPMDRNKSPRRNNHSVAPRGMPKEREIFELAVDLSVIGEFSLENDLHFSGQQSADETKDCQTDGRYKKHAGLVKGQDGPQCFQLVVYVNNG